MAAPQPLDLSRHRDFGELLSTTFALFGSHAAVFLTVTMILVGPVTLVVDGIWGRALAEGATADPSLAVQGVGGALNLLVIPLVTAMQVVIVQGLARGGEPTVRDALRGASGRFLPVLGAVLLYSLGIAAGLALLIVPGIWLAVRWYFAAQAAVVDRVGPVGALRRSGELVRGQWWRTFGVVLAAGLLFAIGGALVTAVLGAVDSGAIYVAGLIVVEAVVLSLTTIFATLLFYDLRARRELPWQGAGRVDSEAPERPADGPP
jgi:hypothetical protein